MVQVGGGYARYRTGRWIKYVLGCTLLLCTAVAGGGWFSCTEVPTSYGWVAIN